MAKSIYVGNLPFTANEQQIRDLFSQYGTVQAVKLVSDRDTGRPRGFAFVEMEASSAEAAIKALDGSNFGGRNLKVNEAKEREQRSERSDRPPRRPRS